jgi:LAS superfamily LD-carboxypeptidase LdcB
LGFDETSVPPLPLDAEQLTGRARTHVIELPEPCGTLHPAAADALVAMRAAAAAAGIDLAVVSSFRDFQRQCAIWNAKFRGERALLDRRGRPLDVAALDHETRIDSILMWSALPGASRHHWGSDIDVIDRAALPPGYRYELVPEEFAPDGVFAALGAWLGAHLPRFGFYRPYATDRGGVQPEPWHLSFAPVSEPALAGLTPQVLRSAIAASAIEGRDAVLGRLDALHARYVTAVDRAPPQALAYASSAIRSRTRPS